MIVVLYHVLYRRAVQQRVSGAVSGRVGERLGGERTDFAGGLLSRDCGRRGAWRARHSRRL